jgi:NAD(P)-dependent dehydrogenase (short-subunit alcohol dehydrogenase family)
MRVAKQSSAVAVVVGGSGGVGAAVAQTLARAGLDVVVTFRSHRERAQQAVDAITAAGQRGWSVQLDVAQASDVKALFEEIPRRHGPVGAVVYAVGASIEQPLIAEVTHAQWASVMDADANGFFHVVSSALPGLRDTGGSLVAVTSAGLFRYPPGDILSVAPKAAIEALTRGVAREEGRFGVRANCVALGVIETGMFLRLQEQVLDQAWQEAARRNTPLGRWGTADEVAHAVAFLVSEKSAFITGQTLRVDGGYSI